jgi:hypothetical protein
VAADLEAGKLQITPGLAEMERLVKSFSHGLAQESILPISILLQQILVQIVTPPLLLLQTH